MLDVLTVELILKCNRELISLYLLDSGTSRLKTVIHMFICIFTL